ncbi:MAG: hypothetical protein QOI61_1349 [Actinomycetota bacterium]
MLEYMTATSGGCYFVVRGATDLDGAKRALRRAGLAISRIPHPDEPEDGLPNFVSAVTIGPDGPMFSIDVKDMFVGDRELAAQVLEVVRTQLDDALDACELGFPSGLPQAPPAKPLDPANVFIARFAGRDSPHVELVYLAAAIAGDEDPYHPTSISRVLAGTVEAVSRATLDDEERQALRPLAYRLASTRRDPEAERERRARLLDWWVRQETPAVLSLMGVSGDALAGLPSLAEPFELPRALDVLATAVESLCAPRDSFPKRCYRRGNNEWEVHGHLEFGLFDRYSVGLTRTETAGTRFYERIRGGIERYEEAGVSLTELAWRVVWHHAVVDALMLPWGRAYEEASALARRPPNRVFPDWSERWPPVIPAVAEAAAARMHGAPAAWDDHVLGPLRADEMWNAFRDSNAKAGNIDWVEAFEVSLGRHFDELVDERFYGNVARCGLLSLARTCHRLARYILVLAAREAAYVDGASDAQADDAADAAIREADAHSHARLRALVDALLSDPA